MVVSGQHRPPSPPLALWRLIQPLKLLNPGLRSCHVLTLGLTQTTDPQPPVIGLQTQLVNPGSALPRAGQRGSPVSKLKRVITLGAAWRVPECVQLNTLDRRSPNLLRQITLGLRQLTLSNGLRSENCISCSGFMHVLWRQRDPLELPKSNLPGSGSPQVVLAYPSCPFDHSLYCPDTVRCRRRSSHSTCMLESRHAWPLVISTCTCSTPQLAAWWL